MRVFPPSVSKILIAGAALSLSGCAAIDQTALFVDRLFQNISLPKFEMPELQTARSGNLTATEDEPFMLTLQASDVDMEYGDRLAFTAGRLPQWLYLSRDGKLEGTPKNKDVGLHEIELRVTDLAGQYDTLSLEIDVQNTNDAPVLIAKTLEFAKQDEPYTQILEVQDDDLAYGDRLRFNAVLAPEWLSVSDDATLTGTPANADVGIHKITIEVVDSGGLSAQQHYVVEVKNVNDAPLFNAN